MPRPCDPLYRYAQDARRVRRWSRGVGPCRLRRQQVAEVDTDDTGDGSAGAFRYLESFDLGSFDRARLGRLR